MESFLYVTNRIEKNKLEGLRMRVEAGLGAALLVRGTVNPCFSEPREVIIF